MRLLLPFAVWRIPTTEPVVYLTFDDGPTPELTDWVLDKLLQFQAKASFFCLGKQIEAFPHLIQRMLSEGHSVGNHTYSHLNRWKSGQQEYLTEIEKTDSLLASICGKKPMLFRPPYGKLDIFATIRILKDHKIILWDVMPGDFDPNQSASNCVHCIQQYANQGSIIVLHDNPACGTKLKQILPPLLDYFYTNSFRLEAITC